ncbi:Mini-ribonuclease 3 [Saccharibacillus alkalitolerans]|uniref:Mini-ribonuclease 3 n=1 Tax=Saccharibacillus alkalitolerans TaxID=2705290 RepID=A0ABX0FAW8_9BACL|nr:ribonuclease III domain-containing protein [Saccharibacillus alkalitolerans]NGZ78096.1 ribonuclease III [Saccharibacillus alkalitolerans]
MTEHDKRDGEAGGDLREAAETERRNGADGLLFGYPPSKPPGLLPPLVLAYIGDAVFEVAIRQYLIGHANLRPHHLHREATKLVSAGAQARLLFRIEDALSEEEADIVRRGRNAKSGSVPKNADVLEYRHATALECLAGYLYYAGRAERLEELIRLGLASPDADVPGRT